MTEVSCDNDDFFLPIRVSEIATTRVYRHPGVLLQSVPEGGARGVASLI